MAESVGSIEYTVDINTSRLMGANKRINKSVDGVQSRFNKLSAAIKGALIGTALTSLVKTLTKSQREFDILNARLKTATGSAENAAKAFDALQNFAAKTPFALEQSISAFTKLVNLGLNPSERALMSYGDTASAMGKDLEQLIEAVADAATGEFERLKEFGIKAKNQGDTIAFTFRGVTTEVANNAAAIEEHLIKLGENNFAGAMAERMNTLDGSISNLGDTWDALVRTITQAGPGDLIKESVDAAIEALQFLIDGIRSGQFMAIIESIGGQFSSAFREVRDAAMITSSFMQQAMRDIKFSGGDAADFLSDAFFQFPANIRAIIQIATAHIAGFVDKVKAFANLIDVSLAPQNWFDSDAQAAAFNTFQERLTQIDKVVIDTTSSFLEERQKAIDKVNDEIAAANNLKTAYMQANEESARTQGDVLAGFRIDKPAGTTDPRTKAQDKGLAFAESIIRKGMSPSEQRAQDIAKLEELRQKDIENEEKYQQAIASLRAQNMEDGPIGPLIKSFEQLDKTAGDAIGGIVAGTTDARSAVSNFANEILSQAVSAIIQMGIAQVKSTVMGQAANASATAAGVANASTLTAAYTPAAAAASVATGGAAAGIGLSALAAAVPAMIALFSGGRRHGGPVSAGRMYEVNEGGRPEMLTMGSKQYLMPNANGKVTSNRDMMQSSGVVNNINITTPPGMAADTRTTQNASGGQDIDVMISAVARDIQGRGRIHDAITGSTTAGNRT